ncbi:MAG: hypothetical protein ACFHWX_09145 [Bacteroidota bacterium]
MNSNILIKSFPYFILALFLSVIISGAKANSSRDTEKKIISLSDNWSQQVVTISSSKGLRTFCSNDDERYVIFKLLDEIHFYHDQLEAELKTTDFNHSKRQIRRILKHMEKIDEKYHPMEFSRFFREQCALQTKLDKKSDQYEASFGYHTYNGKVYVQEVQIQRYLKRLTKSIDRIKEDVEHFYIRRVVWES